MRGKRLLESHRLYLYTDRVETTEQGRVRSVYDFFVVLQLNLLLLHQLLLQ